MFKPTSKEIESVINLDEKKRYEYFLKKIVDWEEVWGLFNDGWAMQSDENGNDYFPIWPAKEYADLNRSSEWKEYNSESFGIVDLVNELIPKLRESGVNLSIFPVKSKVGMTLSIDQFIDDLNSEHDKY